MALVDIITLIEKEAAEKAASALDTAKVEVQEIVNASLVKAKDEATALEKDGSSFRETLEKRKNSEFSRNERVAVSTAQQEIVDSVFASATEALQKLSGDDLTAVFTALLKKISVEKGEVKVCGGKKSELEAAVKAAKKDFVVSDATEDCAGGFIFVGDGFEMDFSFQTLVEKEVRSAKEGEIFKALF